MIAFVVADHLKSEPIYDSLLELFAEKHGPEEEKEEHTHKIVMEIVVRHNSDLENQKVGDIPWPGKKLAGQCKAKEQGVYSKPRNGLVGRRLPFHSDRYQQRMEQPQKP